MKYLLTFALATAALCGPFIYDATGTSRCMVSYDTSFNGLYLIKERTCYGRLGIPDNGHEIARRPLFTEF